MLRFRTLSVFALILVLGLSACKKDTDVPPMDDTPDEPETSIRFYAKENDSTYIQGVFVGITPNEADRNNGIYLRSATTNSAGYADFKNLLGNFSRNSAIRYQAKQFSRLCRRNWAFFD